MRTATPALILLLAAIVGAAFAQSALQCTGACEAVTVPPNHPLLLPAGLCAVSSQGTATLGAAKAALAAALSGTYASDAALHAGLFNGTLASSSVGLCAPSSASSGAAAVRPRVCASGTEAYFTAGSAIYATNTTGASDCVVPRAAVATFAYVYNQQRQAGLIPAVGATPTPTPASAGGNGGDVVSSAFSASAAPRATLAAALLAIAAVGLFL